DSIQARIVNLESILAGENAENECRKDFTVSERTAIGLALERELQGRRLATLKQNATDPENFPDRGCQPKGDTRDIAAKAAGFGNGKTYEQAKSVVENAVPELVEAMDSGRVSV